MFHEILKNRSSAESFSSRPVEREKIIQILEAASHASSASGNFPQKIYLLKSPEALKAIQAFTGPFSGDPVVFLTGFDQRKSWKADRFGEEFYESGDGDAVAVTEIMALEASALDLGTLWMRGLPRAEIQQLLDLPEHFIPSSILLVGYPDDPAGENRKHPVDLSDIVEVI